MSAMMPVAAIVPDEFKNLLIKIAAVFLRECVLIYLEKFFEHIVRSGHHDVLPYTNIRNTLFERHAHGFEFFRGSINIIRLYPEVMDASSA
jgi:hypothetical protein